MRCNTGANPPGADFETPEDYEQLIKKKEEDIYESIKSIKLEIHEINKKLDDMKLDLLRRM